MREMQTAPFSNPFEAVSQMWMSAWLQPWAAWQSWAEFWSGPWRQWVDSVAAAPAAWLPAPFAGAGAKDAMAGLLMPWLPRVEAWVKPLEGYPGGEAMRLMLKAALPPLAAAGAGEWLTVDAVVAKKRPEAAEAARTVTVETVPAVPIEAKVERPAVEAPARREPAPAAAATVAPAKVAPAKGVAATAPARTRAAASPKASASAGSAAATVAPAAVAEPKAVVAAAKAGAAPRARRKPKAAPGGKGGASPAA